MNVGCFQFRSSRNRLRLEMFVLYHAVGRKHRLQVPCTATTAWSPMRSRRAPGCPICGVGASECRARCRSHAYGMTTCMNFVVVLAGAMTWCCGMARAPRRRRYFNSCASGSAATSCPARSSFAPRCRVRSSAKCYGGCWWRVNLTRKNNSPDPLKLHG